MSDQPPFWERKTLAEMDADEWEALCDGCGRCCVLKLVDDDEVTHPSSIACRLLDNDTCRCRHYVRRHELVPDCLSLDADFVHRHPWLPASCAYRRISEGRGLAWWHPLVSGDPRTVVEAGIGVQGKTVPETRVNVDGRLDEYVVRWVEWRLPDDDG